MHRTKAFIGLVFIALVATLLVVEGEKSPQSEKVQHSAAESFIVSSENSTPLQGVIRHLKEYRFANQRSNSASEARRYVSLSAEILIDFYGF